MRKPAPANPKYLVISAGYAEVVLEAIQSAKMSTFTPAQQHKLPGLMKELSRYVVAPEEELREERLQLNQEQRKRGRPPRIAS